MTWIGCIDLASLAVVQGIVRTARPYAGMDGQWVRTTYSTQRLGGTLWRGGSLGAKYSTDRLGGTLWRGVALRLWR